MIRQSRLVCLRRPLVGSGSTPDDRDPIGVHSGHKIGVTSFTSAPPPFNRLSLETVRGQWLASHAVGGDSATEPCACQARLAGCTGRSHNRRCWVPTLWVSAG